MVDTWCKSCGLKHAVKFHCNCWWTEVHLFCHAPYACLCFTRCANLLVKLPPVEICFRYWRFTFRGTVPLIFWRFFANIDRTPGDVSNWLDVSDVTVTCVELSVSSAKLSAGTKCLDRSVENFSSSRKIRETVGARCRFATLSTLSDIVDGDDGGVVTTAGTRSVRIFLNFVNCSVKS